METCISKIGALQLLKDTFQHCYQIYVFCYCTSLSRRCLEMGRFTLWRFSSELDEPCMVSAVCSPALRYLNYDRTYDRQTHTRWKKLWIRQPHKMFLLKISVFRRADVAGRDRNRHNHPPGKICIIRCNLYRDLQTRVMHDTLYNVTLLFRYLSMDTVRVWSNGGHTASERLQGNLVGARPRRLPVRQMRAQDNR